MKTEHIVGLIGIVSYICLTLAVINEDAWMLIVPIIALIDIKLDQYIEMMKLKEEK